LVDEAAIDDILSSLDALYCYEMLAVHWTWAVQNRLEGMALVLLNTEFDLRAAGGLANAKVLSTRLAQLGGAITGDPSRFIELSPVEAFSLPASGADIYAILSAALGYERLFIQEYGRFCARVRDIDPLTYEDMIALLKDHVTREDGLEMSLAGYGQGGNSGSR
jgi:ferritin-like protein